MERRRSSIISLSSLPKGPDGSGFLSKLKISSRRGSQQIASTEESKIDEGQVTELRQDNYEAIVMDTSKDVLVEFYWPSV
jgi:hypothetical protein